MIDLHEMCAASIRSTSFARRLDNVVMDEAQPGRVLGVLDWELSTLGDPLADLAYLCMPYHMPQVSGTARVTICSCVPPSVAPSPQYELHLAPSAPDW